jgi:hypothetical protein
MARFAAPVDPPVKALRYAKSIGPERRPAGAPQKHSNVRSHPFAFRSPPNTDRRLHT